MAVRGVDHVVLHVGINVLGAAAGLLLATAATWVAGARRRGHACLVERIQAAFDFRVPDGYRRFLLLQQGDLDTSLEIDLLENSPRGKTATVDGIYSAQSLLTNDANNASCDAAQEMLIIGYNVFGGYLYLSWASSVFGQIFFREPFLDGKYYRVADSFEDFMMRSRPVRYEDEA